MAEEGRAAIDVPSVKRNTLAKQVVAHLIELLNSGQLKPGDKLPSELELIGLLNVSRPVLREALSSLETLEVITRKTRDGTYFNSKVGSKPFSLMLALVSDDLPAIIEARMALELGLVTLAAEKITDSQLARLKGTIERIANSVDNDYGEADIEFHQTIALSAGNPVVEGMIDALIVTYNKINSHIAYRERDVTAQFHTDIYNALAKRDPIEAFTHMYRHLDFVRKKVLASYYARTEREERSRDSGQTGGGNHDELNRSSE